MEGFAYSVLKLHAKTNASKSKQKINCTTPKEETFDGSAEWSHVQQVAP
jgi:hypothetical protein